MNRNITLLYPHRICSSPSVTPAMRLSCGHPMPSVAGFSSVGSHKLLNRPCFLHMQGSISLEVITALLVLSLSFTAFIDVTHLFKESGAILRNRAEGITALTSYYEMALIGVDVTPVFPPYIRLCQREEDLRHILWLADGGVGQQTVCQTPDPMSLVLMRPSS